MQSEKTYHQTQMGTALYDSPDALFQRRMNLDQLAKDYNRLLARFTSGLAGQKLIKALQVHFRNNSDLLEYPKAFSEHKEDFDRLRAVAMLFKLEADIYPDHDYERTVNLIDKLSEAFISTNPIDFKTATPDLIQEHFEQFMSEQSGNQVFQAMTPIQKVLMEHLWIGRFIDGATSDQKPRICRDMLSHFKDKHQGILRDYPKINACLEIQLQQQNLGDDQSFTEAMTPHLEQLMPLNNEIERMPVVYNVMQSALPRQPLAMLSNHLSPSLYQRNETVFRSLFNSNHNIFKNNGCHFDGQYFKFRSFISKDDIQASRAGHEREEEVLSETFKEAFLLDHNRAMQSLEINYDIQQSINDDGNTVTEISSDSCLTIPEAMLFHQVTLMSEASWFGTFQDHLEQEDVRRVFKSPLYEQNFREDKAKAIFKNLQLSLSDFCAQNTIFKDLLPDDEEFEAHQTAWLSAHQEAQRQLPETGKLINEFETQNLHQKETPTSQDLHLLMYLRELSFSENLRALQTDELETLRDSYKILAPIMGSEPAISALFSKQDCMASQSIKLSEYQTQLSDCPHLNEILDEIKGLEVNSKQLATIVKDCVQTPHQTPESLTQFILATILRDCVQTPRQTPESLTQFKQYIFNVKKVPKVRDINNQLKINRNMITVGGIICVLTIVAATAAVMILKTLFAIGLSALALSMGTGIASILYSSRQNLKNQKKTVCTLKFDTGHNHPSMRNRSAVTVKTVFTATVSAIIIASCIGVPTYLFQSSITGGAFTMIPIGSGIMPTITTAAAIGLALLLTIFASILISNFLFGTAASKTLTRTNTLDLRSALDSLLNPPAFNPSSTNSPPSSLLRSPRSLPEQLKQLLDETYASDGENTLQETTFTLEDPYVERPHQDQLDQIAPHIIQSGEYAPKQIAAQLAQFFSKNDEDLIILREVKTKKGAPYYGGGTRLTQFNSKKIVFEVQTLFRLCDQINDVDIMIPIKTTTTCTFTQGDQLESIQACTEISEKHKRLILQALATQHDLIGGFKENNTQHQGGQKFQAAVNSIFGEDTTELRYPIALMNKGAVFEPSVSEAPFNPTAAGELKDQSSDTRGHCNAQRADHMKELNPSTKQDETPNRPSP